MIALIKMNLRLLLRSKGFLFFLLATPILSSFILSMKVDHSVYAQNEEKPAVIELVDSTERAVYRGNTSAYIVKVYDGSGSALSEYVLDEMAKISLFSICRCSVSDMDESQVLAQAKKDAYDDRAGILLYLKEDFEEAALAGDWQSGMKLFKVSEDERQELFEAELGGILERILQIETLSGKDAEAVIAALNTVTEQLPQEEIISLAGKEGITLTRAQSNQVTQIGYAFAFLTLGFLFCGVFVAHTVIEEQNNKVLTRIALSKVSIRSYFISKFVVAFLIGVLQTLVLGICLLLIPGLDFGISGIGFLGVVFLIGLIFGSLSLLLGVILGEVMSANYAVFAVWSISALLSGLYFPLENATKILQTISYLMPQKWFMDAAKYLVTGDNHGYFMVLCVTVAYLVIILSLGCVGLKMKKQDS